MQTNFLIVLATVVAGVIANPVANAQPEVISQPEVIPQPEGLAQPEDLAKREICHHASFCGIGWSGKCEGHCKPYKFSHMSDDGCFPGYNKCCCDKTKA